MMPIWVSTMSGRTPSTQNTAASTMPALVMTAPVADTARTMPVSGAVLGCLFAGPGDQEDRVVDAERHEEQEREQRSCVVERGEAETCTLAQPPSPSAASALSTVTATRISG